MDEPVQLLEQAAEREAVRDHVLVLKEGLTRIFG
jgi:hypothetical protein